MPIPAVLAGLAIRVAVTGAMAGAAAIADAVERKRAQKLNAAPAGTTPAAVHDDTLRLCVLGQSGVGKTTLINAWRGRGVGFGTTPTHLTETHTDVPVTVGHRKILVTKLYDVSGHDIAWGDWEVATRQSNHILYLVNALTLHDEDQRPPGRRASDAWERIIDDVGQIRLWGADRQPDGYVLVVTHRDQDPRLPPLGWDGYHRHVAEQLSPVIFKLGGYERVSVVSGSLDTDAAAEALTDKILAYLP